ncbi:MAG: amidohydrolase family protein [Acidobacteria bacterium]|nr:amidohydrolase family protein [Acidobacteriota bacterium]
MGGVRGETAVRRVVRAQIDRGVDVIKINATERAGLPDTDPRQRTFTDEEIAAIVDEARKSNIYVASHAHGDEGAFASVGAGGRSIEHGTYLSDRTLALMKERGTFFVPTISTMAEMIEPRNDVILQIRGKHYGPRVRETTVKAIKMGVKFSQAPIPSTTGPAISGWQMKFRN